MKKKISIAILGLSVFTITGCSNVKQEDITEVNNTNTQVVEEVEYNTELEQGKYVNNDYGVSFTLPSTWVITKQDKTSSETAERYYIWFNDEAESYEDLGGPIFTFYITSGTYEEKVEYMNAPEVGSTPEEVEELQVAGQEAMSYYGEIEDGSKRTIVYTAYDDTRVMSLSMTGEKSTTQEQLQEILDSVVIEK